MNSFQLQVLDFTYDFPLIYDFSKNVIGFDYRKALNNFMSGVENVIVFLIAVGVVLRQKWMEYDCTERVQLFALQVKEFVVIAYTWMREVGAPAIANAIQFTYNAGVKVRELYNLVSSPLFITL